MISGEIEKAIDPAKVAAILTAVEQLSDNLAKASAETRGSCDRLLAERARESVRTPVLISTLATRVGALSILVFLVPILINLYRYNFRLSAFFDGRADALEALSLPKIGKLTLVDLAVALSPDNLDFGKTPASPVEHAVALAKEMVARQPK